MASWLPIIGDPLGLVAVALREPLWRFVLIVTLAKGARHLALALVAAALRPNPRRTGPRTI